jgi:hypothetical protein
MNQMDINEFSLELQPKVEYHRARFAAWQRRQERAHAQRRGLLGAWYAGKPYRFSIFLERLGRSERARMRFAAHTARVAHALAPRLHPVFEELLRAFAPTKEAA